MEQDTNNTEQETKNTSSFSWKRIGKMVFFVVAPLVLILGAYFAWNSKPVKIFVAKQTKGNIENFLECYELPFYTQGVNALKDHADTVEKLKQVGVESVDASRLECPTSDNSMSFVKTEILITYKDKKTANKVQNILGKDFYSIPFRGEHIK